MMTSSGNPSPCISMTSLSVIFLLNCWAVQRSAAGSKQRRVKARRRITLTPRLKCPRRRREAKPRRPSLDHDLRSRKVVDRAGLARCAAPRPRKITGENQEKKKEKREERWRAPLVDITERKTSLT